MGWNTDSGVWRICDALELRWIWVYGGEDARGRFRNFWTLLAILLSVVFVSLFAWNPQSLLDLSG